MGQFLNTKLTATNNKTSYIYARNMKWNPTVTELLFSTFTYNIISSLIGPQVFLVSSAFNVFNVCV
jgi:hypothetical protein